MNRETESHFSNLPQVDIKRSSMMRPRTHKTCFNTGDLIPLYVDADILPGDTVVMNEATITRMSTPIFPVMDNCYMDIYWFFVPHRLVWDHWREFWGENRTTYWEQPVTYTIPQIEAPANGWDVNSLADYMGLPTGVGGISVNHLPFRAYCQIINDWFRDQNLKDPVMMNTDETTLTGVNYGVNYDYTTDTQLGAKPFKVAKFHDYFTSCLPEPQKGPDVTIPLGLSAPVVTGLQDHSVQLYPAGTGVRNLDINTGNIIKASSGQVLPLAQSTAGYQVTTAGITNPGDLLVTAPSNLYADLTHATSATINQLRQAIAVQEFYEAQARGGSRYIEFIKNIFGITSPDGRQQRAEYLGGERFRINMDQVLQTSSTDATSPQGNTAAFSCTTTKKEGVFSHSFTEHGTLMCVACVRTDHTYQQGIDRMWSRKDWYDYFVPQLANLGEQPVLVKEIYAQGTSADNEAFGYQEAWADYRFSRDYVTSEFRSSYAQSLDSWHYADDYSTRPYLSSEWIDEVESNVARTLAVQNEIQFIGDFYFKPKYVRPMPIYSIPAMLHF